MERRQVGDVARAEDVLDLAGGEKLLELFGYLGHAVRDVQVADHEYQNHAPPAPALCSRPPRSAQVTHEKSIMRRSRNFPVR